MYTPYDPLDLFPFRSRYADCQIVVIRDSEYEELRRDEAKRQITALESKANRYTTAAQEIEVRIKELRQEHNLLEGAKDTEKLTGATK